jgi:glycosyltransferase involved in cell wall biosynthesis
VSSDGRLRILHVSEVHWGGVVSLLEHFLSLQRLAGHDVHLLAPEGPPTWAGPGHRRWDIDRRRPKSYPTALRQLRRTVADLQPDVIHLHSFYAGMLGRLPLNLSWAGRFPVVYQPHAWSTDLFKRRSPAWAVGAAERHGAKRTDVLVANCQDEVDQGARLGVTGPGRVLSVAVDLDRFVPPVSEAERLRQREKLGLEAERLLLVLGRIGHQKGQDLLLPAWEEARPSDTVLALVGPGDPAQIARLAPSQWGTTVKAFPSTDDVREWLAAADLLLLPSRYEGFAVTVAEAMAMGLPVIATAVNGTREAIEEGDLHAAGAVVRLADMKALIREATLRLDDEEMLDAERGSARKRAEAMFQPEVVGRRLEAAYREAMEIQRARSAR